MKSVALVLLVAMAVACGTELEDPPAGRKISGLVTYSEASSMIDTYAKPGLLVLLQELVADEATGMPGQTTAASPAGAIFHRFTDGEIDAMRTTGYYYEISNISLGDPRYGTELDAWPFLALSAVIDFEGFQPAGLQAALQTGPSGAYPNICALGVAQSLLDPTDARTVGAIKAVLSGPPFSRPDLATDENVQTIIAATNAALPAKIIAAVGLPTVVVAKDAPTTDVNMAIADPTDATVPCKGQVAALVQSEIGLQVGAFVTTQNSAVH